MLPRKFKIGSRLRIEHVFEKGRSVSTRFFHWKSLPNRLPHHRFSIVISGSFSKKAVERNLFRRRAYEAIRKNLPPPGKPCYDVVCLLRQAIKKADFGAIEQEIRKLTSWLT